jgi:FtsZ-binding cell division protein ZapB
MADKQALTPELDAKVKDLTSQIDELKTLENDIAAAELIELDETIEELEEELTGIETQMEEYQAEGQEDYDENKGYFQDRIEAMLTKTSELLDRYN